MRAAGPPAGFRYRAPLLEIEEEQALIERIRPLPLSQFEFRGYLAKRRVVSYGWHYKFDERALLPAEEIPEFLLSLRARAATFAGRSADDFAQAIVAEYRPGTAIGWHRDKAVFGEVIGVSLCSPCVFRFRRPVGPAWERYSLTAEPRSVYLLSGAARTDWEHSIPAVASLRYSITFRSLTGAS